MNSKKKKDDNKTMLVEIEGMPGVYTSTGSCHSTDIDYSTLVDRILKPLEKTRKIKGPIPKWPIKGVEE